MASKKIGVSMPDHLIKMTDLDKASNKSARIHELITKGLLYEQMENNPPSRFQTGEFVAAPESFLAFS